MKPSFLVFSVSNFPLSSAASFCRFSAACLCSSSGTLFERSLELAHSKARCLEFFLLFFQLVRGLLVQSLENTFFGLQHRVDCRILKRLGCTDWLCFGLILLKSWSHRWLDSRLPCGRSLSRWLGWSIFFEQLGELFVMHEYRSANNAVFQLAAAEPAI